MTRYCMQCNRIRLRERASDREFINAITGPAGADYGIVKLK